ncbi:Fic family protein [Pontibacter diazotrophicus]|uniref:Fic family protein n=1 Tax=Pontibacter diazotrophicus TaxID=1400979 RepID=A0A3D8LEV8_9BACT|nr:Fic family protein [Pontibacter diazotrophicus]RDV15938.1 Fic family protein [Pontibacter diazotrophicus]
MIYNWQQPDWLEFRYDVSEVEDMLFEFAELTGHVSGMLKALPEAAQLEAVIDMMVAEAIKTSEIEGEYLSRQDVVSSIRNNLGLNQTLEATKDKMAQGAGELMADARKTYADALTVEKLFQWHTMLLKEQKQVKVGVWRSHEEPMQVVSGALGKEKVHFEAPPSSRIPDEMSRFIQWFNHTAPGGGNEIRKAPVRSAVAHLYFETLHPFEDGNGRIGRAIAEKALSQTLGRPVLLSLSRTIEADKKAYYNALEQAQKSNDITSWVIYFVSGILTSQQQAISLVDFILKKSKFFDRFRNSLNERQIKAVRRMLDAGPEGFEGGMNARKYIAITKASKATATRDLQHLLELGAFIQEGGGRSTRYILNI